MAIRLSFVLVMCCCLGADPNVTSSVSNLEQQRKDALSKMASAKARSLSVVEATGKPMTSVLHPKPLLRWSNPTAGSIHGEVFLWSADLRPVAIASIYRWYAPYQDSTVEITSLSTSGLELNENDQTIWKAAAGGVTFRPLNEVTAPAKTRVSRLRQMRDIARRFAVILADDRGGELVSRDLRLLDQPIYRYGKDDSPIIEGALFVFAENTDPEVLVMVEAISEDQQLRWRYGVARMNAHGLDVKLDGQLIQRWSRVDNPAKDPKSTYAYFNFDPALVKVDRP